MRLNLRENKVQIKDEYVETCTPSGRVLTPPDPVGHRNRKGRTVNFVFFQVH